MDVFQLPFNKFIGLIPSNDPDYIAILPAAERFGNHLGTVHASALFALAEASSGILLLREFGEVENAVPVVRNVELKYKKPTDGAVFSKAKLTVEKSEIIDLLEKKKRAQVPVLVSLHDTGGILLVQASFEWFIIINTGEE